LAMLNRLDISVTIKESCTFLTCILLSNVISCAFKKN
jgi:hypothetical protein